ncbi:energy-coupled thiamine transporter ThiT [Streptococcus orisasini]|uniref:energy-coupled thiamine transporter ThiT n=1 Tax=Streptococcus orisasini TaxID=1080071 RepID=UPI000708FC86|nr:energy-coupled thiamine transporter ThiT [Streptococcus orisasini]
MTKNSVILVEAALAAALAMVLSLLPDFASWFTPSFGAIPLIIFSLRRGTKYGILSGLLWGLLHFLLAKVYYLALSQVILEYILAFLCMGLAGLVQNPFQQSLKKGDKSKALFYAIIGAFAATFTRYVCHYVAGFIFWGNYAPKGMSPFWYSFTVNGSAGLFTFLAVILVLLVLVPSQPQFFLPKKKNG